jgi:hypothetical protein
MLIDFDDNFLFFVASVIDDIQLLELIAEIEFRGTVNVIKQIIWIINLDLFLRLPFADFRIFWNFPTDENTATCY